MKRKTNVFNTLRDLVILTADTGEIMPDDVEPIAEKARMQLGLETPMQAVLLSAFADMYEAESVTPSNLAKHFDVKPIMILSVLHELDFFLTSSMRHPNYDLLSDRSKSGLTARCFSVKKRVFVK